jgi:hypothetical protein
MLSANSRAFSLPETHFFSGVLPSVGGDPRAAVELVSVRTQLESEAGLQLPGEFWAKLATRTDIRGLDVFVAVVEHFRVAGCARAIEKTPRHVLHMNVIGEVFPDAMFVNVVRDPVDVASSLQQVPFRSSQSMLSHAQRWRESVEVARAYALEHPDRIRTVTYESLVRDPEAELRKLCGFVGLEYESAMLAGFGREAERNVGRDEAWKRDIAAGVVLDRKGVWRSRMTPGQAWLVVRSTASIGRAYGYATEPSASPASIAAALAREASVRFREARRSTGMVGAARHAGSVLRTLSPA